jgi:hypothetical protein
VGDPDAALGEELRQPGAPERGVDPALPALAPVREGGLHVEPAPAERLLRVDVLAAAAPVMPGPHMPLAHGRPDRPPPAGAAAAAPPASGGGGGRQQDGTAGDDDAVGHGLLSWRRADPISVAAGAGSSPPAARRPARRTPGPAPDPPAARRTPLATAGGGP